MNRRLLQVVLAILSLSPLGFGGLGLLFGPAGLSAKLSGLPADVDSHFRYLSGIFFMLGIALWTCIPRIETREATIRFRWIAAAVVAGGLARGWGMVTGVTPGLGHQIGLAVELVATPLVVLWQAQVSRRV